MVNCNRQEYLQNNKANFSVRRRCGLISISSSNLYYKTIKDEKNQDLCSLILDIWLERNNKGWRTIQADLQEYNGLKVNHKKLRRLMHKLGILGILPKKNTSKSKTQHYKYHIQLKIWMFTEQILNGVVI